MAKKSTKKTVPKRTAKQAAPKSRAKKTTAKSTSAKQASKRSSTPSAGKAAKKSTRKASAEKKMSKSAAKRTAAKEKTTTKTAPKKSAAKKAPAKRRVAVEQSEQRPGPTKHPRLSKQDLKEYRELLIEKRAELLGAVTNLESEAFRTGRSEAAGDLSFMPIHMADIGTDNYEQEFTLGLIESERQLLREIDEALVRIEEGTFGLCQATGKPITKARLRAKPWANYCYEYVLQQEQAQRRGY